MKINMKNTKKNMKTLKQNEKNYYIINKKKLLLY